MSWKDNLIDDSLAAAAYWGYCQHSCDYQVSNIQGKERKELIDQASEAHIYSCAPEEGHHQGFKPQKYFSIVSTLFVGKSISDRVRAQVSLWT